VLSHLGLFSDYLASFQWSQVLLSLCDRGLQAVEAVVQVPIIKSLRRRVRATRRAGSKRAGPPRPVAGIGEASMLGALAEIFGANFFLSIIGLELVPVHKVSRKVVSGGTVKPSSNSALSQKFEDLDLVDYVSDQDADYSPSEESSQGSIEFDSEVEDKLEDAETVYEDEHAKVIEGDSSAGDEDIINAEDYECDPIESEHEANDFEKVVAVEKVETVYIAESDAAEAEDVDEDYSKDVGSVDFINDFSTNVEKLRAQSGDFTEEAGFECLDKYFTGEADAVCFSENAVDESFAEHVESEYLDGDFFENVEDFTEKVEAEQLYVKIAEYLE